MDPSNSFDIATAWISGVMLGEVATKVAVIAVAGMGYAMLQGRQSARDGIRILLGCVVLFNAPTIAEALSYGADEPVATSELPPPVSDAPITVIQYAQAPYDPYAGASVPQ